MKKVIASKSRIDVGLIEDTLYQVWQNYRNDGLDEEDIIDIVIEHLDIEESGGPISPEDKKTAAKYVEQHYYDYDWE